MWCQRLGWSWCYFGLLERGVLWPCVMSDGLQLLWKPLCIAKARMCCLWVGPAPLVMVARTSTCVRCSSGAGPEHTPPVLPVPDLSHCHPKDGAEGLRPSSQEMQVCLLLHSWFIRISCYSSFKQVCCNQTCIRTQWISSWAKALEPISIGHKEWDVHGHWINIQVGLLWRWQFHNDDNFVEWPPYTDLILLVTSCKLWMAVPLMCIMDLNMM